jgi:deazaflavin-dependent oxidoreductase (nitroreductase family)
MGVASELSYAIGPRNRARRAVAAFGSTRPVSALSNKIIRPIDRWVLRASGGRATATSWLLGIPPLWLITTGAKSGRERSVPLFGIPIEGDLALLGTSFAKRETPAWVYNLEANPGARVAYRDNEVPVQARPAGPDEASTIWETAAGIYPGYANYRDRAAHRTIRVFVLEPDENGSVTRQVGSM